MKMIDGIKMLAHLGLRVFLRLHCGFRARGQVRLDRPSVLVANHASHIDIAAIFAAIPIREVPRVRTAAARDVIYAFPRPVVAVIEFLFGTYPFERRARSTESLERGEAFVRAGYHLAIFPEGRRNDGAALAFTPGFAKIAWRTGAPVIPIVIRGADRTLPPGSAVVQRLPIEVEFRGRLRADRSVAYGDRRSAYGRLVRETEAAIARAG